MEIFKHRGGRTLNQAVIIEDNSGGQNHFQEGQNTPFAPPRKIPAVWFLNKSSALKVAFKIGASL